MLEVECLKQEIKSGSATYPVYVGFLPASDIARVAEAPAFTTTTPHDQIASNVSSQPVRDWQRPLDVSRISGIADVFDNTGNLMPNPILLGQNAFVNGKIKIEAKHIGSGVLSGTWKVKIDDNPAAPGQRPLWILDGQHRVAGLSQSHQQANHVPVVFLLDGGSGAYTSPLLASLFAQVTTSATKLDELHNEWLTFAFSLGSYAPTNIKAQDERLAFETVIELCRTPAFGSQGNPFLSAVQFNEHLVVQPSHGGFSYKCTELKNLILKSYFNQPTKSPRLLPIDLAGQIAMAYSDLWAIVGSQQNTVFFGPSGAQGIMQDAYLTGVLARILDSGPMTTWKTLLQALNFHQSSWEFSWVRALGGRENTASKNIATNTLTEALTTGSLPKGSGNLPDHLRGNAADVTIAFSALTPAGRPKKNGKQTYSVLRGGNTATALAKQLPHVKVVHQSSNIGKLEIVDAKTPGGQIQYPQLMRGMIPSAISGLPNPMNLMFLMTHYGGQTSTADLEVGW